MKEMSSGRGGRRGRRLAALTAACAATGFVLAPPVIGQSIAGNRINPQDLSRQAELVARPALVKENLRAFRKRIVNT